jgi:hypothetical protein
MQNYPWQLVQRYTKRQLFKYIDQAYADSVHPGDNAVPASKNRKSPPFDYPDYMSLYEAYEGLSWQELRRMSQLKVKYHGEDKNFIEWDITLMSPEAIYYYTPAYLKMMMDYYSGSIEISDQEPDVPYENLTEQGLYHNYCLAHINENSESSVFSYIKAQYEKLISCFSDQQKQVFAQSMVFVGRESSKRHIDVAIEEANEDPSYWEDGLYELETFEEGKEEWLLEWNQDEIMFKILNSHWKEFLPLNERKECEERLEIW